MKKYRKSITMSNTIDELYEEYQNRTFGKAKYLRSKGITPKAINFISKDRFKDAFSELKFENKKISASSAIDKIVAKGLRTSSKEQAMNVAKQSKMPGSKYSRQYTVLEAMYSDDIWEEIIRVYKEQRDSGKTAENTKHHIAMTFFGSN